MMSVDFQNPHCVLSKHQVQQLLQETFLSFSQAFLRQALKGAGEHWSIFIHGWGWGGSSWQYSVICLFSSRVVSDRV